MSLRLTLIAVLVTLTLLPAQAATKHAIDSTGSNAQFTVSHIFVETVSGVVPVQSGSVDLLDGSVVPTSITATLDPTRLKTGDEDRDGVLQTADWFDTKRFPTWTFVSTSIAAGPANTFSVDGLLTVHGVSAKVHLNTTVRGDPAHPQYHAVGTVDRRVFGMTKTRLDPVIGNDVAIVIDARLK